MRLKWDDIQSFLRVAREGSLTLAAEHLGISQPTLTRRIADIEAVAGRRLFQRGPQGMTLTEFGRKLVPQAVRAEAEFARFQRELVSRDTVDLYRVAVKASEGVATFLLAPLVSGAAYGPMGSVARRESIRLPPIRFLPPETSLDADIRFAWSTPGNLPVAHVTERMRSLADIHFQPFVAEGSNIDDSRFDTLSRKPLATLSDYLFFDSDESLGPWNSLVRDAGERILETNWSSTLGRVIANGDCVGLLPSYSNQFADFHLVPLSVKTPSMIARLWLIGRATALDDNPAVRECFDKITAAFEAYRWS